MKRLVCFTTVLALVVAAYWTGSSRSQQHIFPHTSRDPRKVLYDADPMNPAHMSDKAGKAPCGMDMEPVYLPTTHWGLRPALTWPRGRGQRSKCQRKSSNYMGVRIAMVEKKALVHRLRLPGKVAADETRIYRINAAVDGWITKTMPVSAGSLVRKNETLGAFYSLGFSRLAKPCSTPLVPRTSLIPTSSRIRTLSETWAWGTGRFRK